MATKTANVKARVPFSLDIPDKLATRDSITQAEFDTMMQTGLAQAKRIDAVSVDEAFNQLKACLLYTSVLLQPAELWRLC